MTDMSTVKGEVMTRLAAKATVTCDCGREAATLVLKAPSETTIAERQYIAAWLQRKADDILRWDKPYSTEYIVARYHYKCDKGF